jgi:hypothetical protein
MYAIEMVKGELNERIASYPTLNEATRHFSALLSFYDDGVKLEIWWYGKITDTIRMVARSGSLQ